jgi:hypothetical protein
MPDPQSVEEQAALAVEQRRQAQERRSTVGYAFFLALVILGALWLAGAFAWVVRVFHMVAGG